MIIKIKMVLALIAILFATNVFADAVDNAEAMKARAEGKELPKMPKAAFDEALTKNLMEVGNVEIKGVLLDCYSGGGCNFMKDGLPVAGVEIWIFPYTPYTVESLKLIKKNKDGSKFKLDDRFFKYMIKVVTDEYGLFSFPKMKPGKYYIESDFFNGKMNQSFVYSDEYHYQHSENRRVSVKQQFSKVIEVKQDSGVYKLEAEAKRL
jgi:hypothetical protein